MDSEKLAIRAICLGTPQGPVREAILPVLRAYRWQVPLHQIIFEALASILSDDPAILRQLLPAKLTCLGFPDVEWEEFFTPLSLSRDETIAMVRRMVAEQRPS